MLMRNIWIILFLLMPVVSGCSPQEETGSLRSDPIQSLEAWNALERTKPVQHIVCSGSGALRLISYLECSKMVIAVEQTEKSGKGFAPYRVVHSEYGKLPVFGEGHGRDNIEFLLNMNPKPDLIVRIDNPGSGLDPGILQERTGIPVVLVPYGDFGKNRALFDRSLRLLGSILGKTDRAESLIAFIDSEIEDLNRRTRGISLDQSPTAYLGGLSYRGSHGINSTSSEYPPFDWLHLENPASSLRSESIKGYHAMISKEQIVFWNPDYIFIDLGTLGLEQANGWTEMRDQSIYQSIEAVKQNRIYGLYPNNSYNTNFESMIANGWFIGKTVFPDRFQDIKLDDKIRQVFDFMLGDPFIPNCPDTLKSNVYKPIFRNKNTVKTDHE